MIKIINYIRMIMAMAVLSVVLFSCVREEMTCDKELIVVQRIGEEFHARIQQSGPILQRRDGGCQVGVNRGTCIEVWLGNGSIGSQ